MICDCSSCVRKFRKLERTELLLACVQYVILFIWACIVFDFCASCEFAEKYIKIYLDFKISLYKLFVCIVTVFNLCILLYQRYKFNCSIFDVKVERNQALIAELRLHQGFDLSILATIFGKSIAYNKGKNRNEHAHYNNSFGNELLGYLFSLHVVAYKGRVRSLIILVIDIAAVVVSCCILRLNSIDMFIAIYSAYKIICHKQCDIFVSYHRAIILLEQINECIVEPSRGNLSQLEVANILKILNSDEHFTKFLIRSGQEKKFFCWKFY